MRVRTRSTAAAAVALLALLPAAGAAEAAAGYPVHAHCDAMRTPAGPIAVAGSAVVEGPALDTRLVCRVFVDGVHVGSVEGAGAGPVGVAVGAISGAPRGVVTSCAEVWYVSNEGSIPERPCV